ncbi:MAG: ubiquinone/menaquinone biosynthesis methyltransferase, partial [Bradymonadaceae bacterium]
MAQSISNDDRVGLMQNEEIQGTRKELDGGDGAFFDAIAHRYDLLNRLLSMGLDGHWRKKAVEALNLTPGDRVLDLATGTADLAMGIAQTHPGVRIQGVDPSKEMVAIARQKVEAAGLESRIGLELGDGQALAFDDDTFDGAAIAFGIRNFPDRIRGLEEMTRVTRQGGKVVILELSEPRDGLLSGMARFYVHQCVPRIGSVLSGKKEYRYLQESIAAFPSADNF